MAKNAKKTKQTFVDDAWLKALVNKELDKVFARFYAKQAKLQKAAKKAKIAKKPSFIDLTVKGYAAEGWACYNRDPADVKGKIPANFGKYEGPLGGGHQGAAHKLGSKYALKIQHHFSKAGADLYVKKLNHIKEQKYECVVNVHAAGFFAQVEKEGRTHYYTYEILDLLAKPKDAYAKEGKLWDAMKKNHLHHTDCHGGNIMADKDGNLRVIDLESLIIYKDANHAEILYGHNGRRPGER